MLIANIGIAIVGHDIEAISSSNSALLWFGALRIPHKAELVPPGLRS